MEIGKISCYHILAIISLVHVAIYAWFWSDGSQIFSVILLIFHLPLFIIYTCQIAMNNRMVWV